MDKLKVGWGLRARKYEWGIESREVIGYENESFEKDLINRERDLQRQWEKERIDRSKYNKRYKEIRMENRVPNYLRVENME
ncbi:hypothetical protein ALC53_04760 [Atta colombica]|uniref:Uncharacterized protein n=1 Tax=Atta colombica TaxID=520822 RepID=A0A195BK00_9HYME|nr:hypothetical protein ALC53_04760 [Atta colombica]